MMEEPGEKKDIFYDVGLAKWIITDIDEKMSAKLKWPTSNPSTFVKKESKLNSDWSEQFIKVKRFYGKYYCQYLLHYRYIYIEHSHFLLIIKN